MTTLIQFIELDDDVPKTRFALMKEDLKHLDNQFIGCCSDRIHSELIDIFYTMEWVKEYDTPIDVLDEALFSNEPPKNATWDHFITCGHIL